MNTTATIPQVGQGATLDFPQDSYPYVITRVSASGKTVWAQPVQVVSLATGHQPARFDGLFPVWAHKYTEAELAQYVKADVPEKPIRHGKNGWVSGGLRFTVGEAYYSRNYSY